MRKLNDAACQKKVLEYAEKIRSGEIKRNKASHAASVRIVDGVKNNKNIFLDENELAELLKSLSAGEISSQEIVKIRNGICPDCDHDEKSIPDFSGKITCGWICEKCDQSFSFLSHESRLN